MHRKIFSLFICSILLLPAIELSAALKSSVEIIPAGTPEAFEASLQRIEEDALPQSGTPEATAFLAKIQKDFSSKPDHFKLLLRSPLGKKIAQLTDEAGATLLYYSMFTDGEKYVAPLVHAGADRSLRVTQQLLGAENQTPLEFFKKTPMVFYSTPHTGESKTWYTYLEKILDPATDLSSIKEPFQTNTFLETGAEDIEKYLQKIDEKTLPNPSTIKALWDRMQISKANDGAWLEAIARYKDGLLFTMKDNQNKGFSFYTEKKPDLSRSPLQNILSDISSAAKNPVTQTKKQLQALALVTQKKEDLKNYLDSVVLTSGTTFSTVQEAILNKKMDDPEWLKGLFAYKNGYFLDTKGFGGNTLLHTAIATKKALQIIQQLIDFGASLTAQNESGKTPQDLYVEKEGAAANWQIIQALKPKDYFGNELVTKKPADVQSFLKSVRGSIPPEGEGTIFDYTYKTILENESAKNDAWLDAFLTFENNRFVHFVADDDETFLHKAARRKDETVITALMRNGADSTKKNIRDSTPLDLYRAKTSDREAGNNPIIIELLTPKDPLASSITLFANALNTLHSLI